MPRAVQRTFSVAGLNVLNTDHLFDNWRCGVTADVKAVREPNNAHDHNAIAIKINGVTAGRVPKELTPELAAYMDDGYQAELTLVDLDYHEDEKDVIEDEFGYEYARTYAVAKVQIYLIPPNPTEKQTERFNQIREQREQNHEAELARKEAYLEAQRKASELRRTQEEYLAAKKSESDSRKVIAVLAGFLVLFIVAIVLIAINASSFD